MKVIKEKEKKFEFINKKYKKKIKEKSMCIVIFGILSIKYFFIFNFKFI